VTRSRKSFSDRATLPLRIAVTDGAADHGIEKLLGEKGRIGGADLAVAHGVGEMSAISSRTWTAFSW